MESLKIFLSCVAAAILYGIVHDQFTARICLEYFTLFHPPIFPTQSPTLLGIAWGIIATWWAGALIGVFATISARAGRPAKLSVADLLKPIAQLLLVMAISALVCGVLGFVLATRGIISPPGWVALQLPAARYPRFMADWWAHTASYGCGLLGGLILCVSIFRRRGFQNQVLKNPT